MKKLSFFLITFSSFVVAQSKKIEQSIATLYETSLTDGASYDWLDHLSNQIGGRLSGSLNAERAVQWGKEELDQMGLDRVYLQEVMVPKWVRGTFEYANIETSPGNTINVPICALGGSIATPAAGIRAGVVEVQSIDELKSLGREVIQGKIVFFNRPMNPTNIRTFEAYSDAVDQRTQGAAEASKYGAVAAVVRSMSLRLDDFPHTGATQYKGIPLSQRIPASAISTNGAELLSSMLKLNPDLRFFLKQNCKNYPDVLSHNVIGEIKGTEKPEEIIVVGGHLDSWDLGDGSHDDGAGIVQSMEVLRLFKKLNIKPKRTLRVVLFMNEENGLRGGEKYAAEAKRKGESHYFALESDSGGFTPRGFSFDCSNEQFQNLLPLFSYFEPYPVKEFTQGGSGADIGPLKDGKVILAGLRPDSQRYFDYHHAANDTFDAINKRELELGAAAMAALVFLIDQR
ncbi:MAG TPA: peptidase M28 family protein [Flavobacteriaceae bacterium]|nr:MAG: Bacterial leucyl aminopeptidase [Flavobacteriaceae bacterium]HCQ24749.1 peptidase M28 family protein [Flavobacteriaceae bacterium]|tara:strand:+ start:22353 stop:23720 length:1368 start_codon:yes stop_codon:yes gene_type:complete